MQRLSNWLNPIFLQLQNVSEMERKSFAENLNGLSLRYGVDTVFSDMLTMIICGFSMQKQEELYFETIKPYKKSEVITFADAFASLVVEMTGDARLNDPVGQGSGMVDVLGEYFMEFLSFGRNGQFFTPMHICDMMARMNNPVHETHRILDPACGSGRMLMSMAKLNRFAMFYGADCDSNCAKMTVINMCLNSMYGEVAWMDSLANRWYAGWKIERTIYGIPCIRKISEKESEIHLKLPAAHEIPAVPKPLPEFVLQAAKQSATQTQMIFDF